LLDSIISAVAAFIIATIAATGLLGVALMMAIESACIPLPSEVILPFSGYLASLGQFSLTAAATAGALGCNLGSTAAYAVGRHGGRRFVERWGSYFLVTRRDLEWADRFFARYGSFAVFIARLLPVVRTFIALPAGIAGMPMFRFQVYTFLGSWPWCFALAYVGYRLGKAWESDPELRAIMHRFDALVIALILAGIVWYVWRHWRHRVGSKD
jgi:membrane protein DedA with SNARE-associated domain